MKVYINLQRARVELQKMNLKKSGVNKFAGYTYFELKDFLPTINELLEKHNLCSFVQFTAELATLTIVSTEDGSTVQFTSPMASANLKGCHDVQNLGAVQTYIRRYLYTNAFEIVEGDALDATHGRDDNKQQAPTSGQAPTRAGGKLSDKQVNRLIAIAKSKGVSVDKVTQRAHNDYGVTNLENLTRQQYDEICSRLEAIQR